MNPVQASRTAPLRNGPTSSFDRRQSSERPGFRCASLSVSPEYPEEKTSIRSALDLRSLWPLELLGVTGARGA